jgi:hypothetical protein
MEDVGMNDVLLSNLLYEKRKIIIAPNAMGILLSGLKEFPIVPRGRFVFSAVYGSNFIEKPPFGFGRIFAQIISHGYRLCTARSFLSFLMESPKPLGDDPIVIGMAPVEVSYRGNLRKVLLFIEKEGSGDYYLEVIPTEYISEDTLLLVEYPDPHL